MQALVKWPTAKQKSIKEQQHTALWFGGGKGEWAGNVRFNTLQLHSSSVSFCQKYIYIIPLILFSSQLYHRASRRLFFSVCCRQSKTGAQLKLQFTIWTYKPCTCSVASESSTSTSSRTRWQSLQNNKLWCSNSLRKLYGVVTITSPTSRKKRLLTLT